MTLIRSHHLLSVRALSAGSADMRRPIDNALLGSSPLGLRRYRQVSRRTHAYLLQLLGPLQLIRLRYVIVDLVLWCKIFSCRLRPLLRVFSPLLSFLPSQLVLLISSLLELLKLLHLPLLHGSTLLIREVYDHLLLWQLVKGLY